MWEKNQNLICVIHTPQKNNFLEFCYVYTDGYQQAFKTIAWSTQKTYASTTASTMSCNTATSPLSALTPPQHCRAPRLLGRMGSMTTSLCVASTRLPAAAALHQLRCAPRLLVSRPQRLYHNYITRLGVSARRVARRRLLRLAQARHRLLRLRRASGCLGTSRGSSRRSSSTTSPPPRVRVPRHVAQLVTRLVVDYFADTARPGASARRAARRVAPRRLLRLAQLVVDYFAYAARLSASARCAARRRLLRLSYASSCLDSSSTTSPKPCVRVPKHVARLVADVARPGASAHHVAPRRLFRLVHLVVDYFSYVARPGASARHAARRRLLRPRRTSDCLGTSSGSSCGSSSTSSPTPHVRVPRHVARLVVDHASSRRSTSRRSVALALTVRPIAPSRSSTTPCRHSTCCPVALTLLQPRRAS
jgi:hypothetical protein